MRYVSTRGGAPAAGFLEVLLAGLAPDGGLYVPEVWPSLSAEDRGALAGGDYVETCARILARFAGDDLALADARADAAAAYAGFATRQVAPLRQLEGGLFLLELFHGPSLAFKDIAMQLLARLYARALEAQDRRLTIVCATSGDTGGAAVEAFAGQDRIRLVVLYPEGRISEVQRRFMTCHAAPNVAAVAVRGDFDDCQALVKGLFADPAFVAETRLSGVNSINFARIIAQSVYFATSLAALGEARGAAFAVPTGNFGDAFAGWTARRLGLNVGEIRVATNANDILARALATGAYVRGPAVMTQSPAMDIQVASNFERLFFEASGRDAAATRAAFEQFQATGSAAAPAGVAEGFSARAVSEAETIRAIREAHARWGLVVDPHTAVALAAAEGAGPRPMVVLATAHPAKFPEAVQAALGLHPVLPPGRADLLGRPERIVQAPAELPAIRDLVRSLSR